MSAPLAARASAGGAAQREAVRAAGPVGAVGRGHGDARLSARVVMALTVR